MDVWMATVTIALIVLTYIIIELVQLAAKPPRITHTRETQTYKQ